MEEKIIEIMKEVFDDPSVNSQTSQQNCDNWDSLHHLNFVVELEDAFDISLEPEEIARMQSFDDVVKIVKEKM